MVRIAFAVLISLRQWWLSLARSVITSIFLTDRFALRVADSTGLCPRTREKSNTLQQIPETHILHSAKAVSTLISPFFDSDPG